MPIPSIPTMFVSGKRKRAPKNLQTTPLTIRIKAPFPTPFFIKIGCTQQEKLYKCRKRVFTNRGICDIL